MYIYLEEKVFFVNNYNKKIIIIIAKSKMSMSNSIDKSLNSFDNVPPLATIFIITKVCFILYNLGWEYFYKTYNWMFDLRFLLLIFSYCQYFFVKNQFRLTDNISAIEIISLTRKFIYFYLFLNNLS